MPGTSPMIKFLSSAGAFLCYLVNYRAQQINYLLLNNTDLLNFVSRSPVISLFYKGKTLSALARLKKYIISAGEPPFPRNSLRKSRFVKNIVVVEGGGKNQVFGGGVWPASDELVVHIGLFRLLS